MSLIANCIDFLSSKCINSVSELTNDLENYFDQGMTAKPSSQYLHHNLKSSHKTLIHKALTKPKMKPFVGYSPQRQRSLVLQIKNVERRKKQLIDELKIVDKSLISLIDERSKYQKLAKSQEKVNPQNEFMEKNEQAMNFVRKMKREKKMMDLRRNKTEERVNTHIQRSHEKAEEIRRLESVTREQRKKQISDGIEKRRANILRNPVTSIRQKNDNSFLTEVGQPIHINTLPKLQTKKYPKTKIYKLISEETRMKKVAEELKERNKIYNLEKRKLYNFLNRDKQRDFFSEKSYVYHIKEF